MDSFIYLKLDTFIIASRDVSQKSKSKRQTVSMGPSSPAVSSGSTLIAKVSGFVYRVERGKQNLHNFNVL